MNRRFLNVVAHIWPILIVFAISLNAEAYTIQYQQSKIEPYGLTENSYSVTASAISASAKAVYAGQVGTSHTTVIFKIISDNGDATVKTITVPTAITNSGYQQIEYQIIENPIIETNGGVNYYSGGVQLLGSTSQGARVLNLKLKTNTTYQAHVAAQVITSVAGTVVTVQMAFMLPGEMVVMPVASAPIVKLVSDTVPVATAVAAIQAVATSCGTPTTDTTGTELLLIHQL